VKQGSADFAKTGTWAQAQVHEHRPPRNWESNLQST